MLQRAVARPPRAPPDVVFRDFCLNPLTHSLHSNCGVVGIGVSEAGSGFQQTSRLPDLSPSVLVPGEFTPRDRSPFPLLPGSRCEVSHVDVKDGACQGPQVRSLCRKPAIWGLVTQHVGFSSERHPSSGWRLNHEPDSPEPHSAPKVVFDSVQLRLIQGTFSGHLCPNARYWGHTAKYNVVLQVPVV